MIEDKNARNETTIPDEPAFAVVDASGHIDPMSVRRYETTCVVYIRLKRLEDQERYYVVPVRIVAARGEMPQNNTTREDRVPHMRQTWREITESDRGECQMMADYRWACDEIERLRGLLWEVMSAPEAAYHGDWFARATEARPCQEDQPAKLWLEAGNRRREADRLSKISTAMLAEAKRIEVLAKELEASW